MAFEVKITPEGWNSLVTKGFLNTVKYAAFSDVDINYKIDENSDKIPDFNFFPVGGNLKENTTLAPCSLAEEMKISIDELPPEVIEKSDMRANIQFVSEDCSYQYQKQNVEIQVNLEAWVNQLLSLESVSYDKNNFLEKQLVINFWDYISVYLEKWDLTNKSWNFKEEVTGLNISYRAKSSEDNVNYLKTLQSFMEITNSGRKDLKTGVNQKKYLSNLYLSWESSFVTGNDIFGSSAYLTMWPNSFGYIADGLKYNTGDFENGVQNRTISLSQFETVYPYVMIGDEIYTKKNNNVYYSPDGLAEFLYGFSNNEKSALKALTEQLLLYVKMNWKEVETGVYENSFNLTTNLSGNKNFNQIYNNEYVGGNIKFILTYNTNSISPNVWELIN